MKSEVRARWVGRSSWALTVLVESSPWVVGASSPKPWRTAATVRAVVVSSRLSETRSASTRLMLMPRSMNPRTTSSARPGTEIVKVSKQTSVVTSIPPATKASRTFTAWERIR
jgi:hypothetical protein